jgi:5'-methylthioadenosine phosphorylase
MGRLGIISGTLALQGKSVFGELTEKIVETDFGAALVLHTPQLVLIPRHGRDPRQHILPHRINHAANLAALKLLGVDEVIGLNSTGSLRKDLKPGAIVIPDDYILLDGGPTIFDSPDSKPLHITPVLHDGIRQKALDAARLCGIDAITSGIYWQTNGPRFETRAEIALMSRFADIVGMTMASEAIIAQELDIAYASICSVDNFAHGIGAQKLTLKGILEHARRNTEAIISIILKYLEGRTT